MGNYRLIHTSCTTGPRTWKTSPSRPFLHIPAREYAHVGVWVLVCVHVCVYVWLYVCVYAKLTTCVIESCENEVREITLINPNYRLLMKSCTLKISYGGHRTHSILHSNHKINDSKSCCCTIVEPDCWHKTFIACSVTLKVGPTFSNIIKLLRLNIDRHHPSSFLTAIIMLK